MAKTRQMDEQITHDIIDQHGLYARFGVDRMTVDRFTQIFYMVWKSVEDALDLTRNLRYALDPFDDGAEEAKMEMTPNYLAFYRGILLARAIIQNGHSEPLDQWRWWNDLSLEERASSGSNFPASSNAHPNDHTPKKHYTRRGLGARTFSCGGRKS